MRRTYPLKRQERDARDTLYAVRDKPQKLPERVDLRDICPEVYDQGMLGSCTANAGVAAYSMLTGTQKKLSRLYLYFMERYLEGTTDVDAGATMRDIGKALHKFGVCSETLWPYVEKKFAVDPPDDADAEAAMYKIDAYRAIPSVTGIKRCLARGKPILIGMDVLPSFESTGKDGVVPVPGKNEQSLGGHAVLVVGYDDAMGKKPRGIFSVIFSALFRTDASGYFIVRNSWGKDWGDKGYCYLPRAYLDAHGFDFWELE